MIYLTLKLLAMLSNINLMSWTIWSRRGWLVLLAFLLNILSRLSLCKNCNAADDDERELRLWCGANTVSNVAHQPNMLGIIGHTVWARKAASYN